MKEIAGVRMTVEASADKLWSVIASIGGVGGCCRYPPDAAGGLPGVHQGVGAALP